jgi:hypothetical protein
MRRFWRQHARTFSFHRSTPWVSTEHTRVCVSCWLTPLAWDGAGTMISMRAMCVATMIYERELFIERRACIYVSYVLCCVLVSCVVSVLSCRVHAVLDFSTFYKQERAAQERSNAFPTCAVSSIVCICIYY